MLIYSKALKVGAKAKTHLVGIRQICSRMLTCADVCRGLNVRAKAWHILVC